MYKLSCNDIGGMDCDHVAEGETKEETKQKLWDHAKEKHADVFSNMTEEQGKEKSDLADKKLAEQDEQPASE